MEKLRFCNPSRDADDIDNIYFKFEKPYMNIHAIVETSAKYISEYELSLIVIVTNCTKDFDGVIEIIIGETGTLNELPLRLANVYGKVRTLVKTPFKLVKAESHMLFHIPKTIHQSYIQNLHINNLKACQSWKLLNPNFEYKFWNDRDCRELIQTHFSKDTLTLYDRLYAGAFKADIFRLCVLYLFGGVWADISTVCENPIGVLFDNDLTLMVAVDDRAQKDDFIGIIWQAFLACPKQSPLIKYILDFTVNRLLKHNEYEKKYPWFKRKNCIHGPLTVTGPTVFGTALNVFMNKDPADIFEEGVFSGIRILTNDSYRVTCSGRPILTIKYEGYEKDRYNIHYSEYYKYGLILKRALVDRKISDKALNIYQIWIQSNFVSDNLYENAATWFNAYSDFNYNLVTETDIISMIKGDKEYPMLYDCYNKLTSYSYKSDLIRAYLIYKNGGLYADLQTQCLNKYKGDFLQTDICVFYNIYSNVLTNSVFYCKRHSNFMKHFLLLMCRQISVSANTWIPDKALIQKTFLAYFGISELEEGVHHKNNESIKIVPYTANLPMPKGTWIGSSRNYVITKGNILEAELLNKNAKWVPNKVKFSAGDLLVNINGALKGNTNKTVLDNPADLFRLSYADFKTERKFLS